MATAAKVTAREAIAKVLKDGKAHKVPEIIEKAVPMTSLGGATPGQTIYSVLYSENKKKGNARQFIQAGRGEFKLNANHKPAERKAPAAKSAPKAAAKKTTTARKSTSSRKRAGRKAAASA